MFVTENKLHLSHNSASVMVVSKKCTFKRMLCCAVLSRV